MFEKAEKILTEYVERGAKVCVAVSGGKDSMCLLDFCLKSGILKKDSVSVVNIDHKIRAGTSERDSAFVKAYCEKNGVEFFGYCVDIPSIAAATGRSVEAAAREERYRIFSRLAESGACKFVLTAHHALDNAETVLMHLFRGSGISGLKGMEILSRGYVLHPFLTTEKSEIDEYAERGNIPFVTDETNADSAYSRNFLRNEIMPLIVSRWGGAVRAVNSLCGEVGAVIPLIDSLADKSLISVSGGVASIDLRAFGNLALAPRYVIRALESLGINCDAERKHIDAVVALARKNTGAAVDLPHGARAEKTYGAVNIFRKVQKEKSEECVPFALGSVEFCGKTIVSERADKAEFGKAGELYFDLKKIPATAQVRFRRDGDKFRPFGGGEKKLKEYFIDKKIPKRLRDEIPLLCDGNRVLAVLGVEISDGIKTESGSEIIRIKICTECTKE